MYVVDDRAAALPPAEAPGLHRPRVAGKFLSVGGAKLWVRGVTYGAFEPGPGGDEYHDPRVIERDFAMMAESGINAVRIPHTMPPRSLLDAAQRHGLWVMVGLSAEQHVGYLVDRGHTRDAEEDIRRKVQACAGHPAILCYALGNEIAAPVVRWLGRARVERYLERLHRVVKSVDPDALVTYVNYPTTEYLNLPFLDVVAFNVYLESPEAFESYLARLQNIAGGRPLIMSELGLDSLRNGRQAQASALEWQIHVAFASGSAGAFVFSWTDEWFRAGADVEDWAFGLTDRERRPKPALPVVRDAYAGVPFAPGDDWPRASVVVCTYNGSRTIRDCLEGLRRLQYPDYEVIVVDDGSTDDTPKIVNEYVRRHGFRVIHTPNRGLGHARNLGLEAATGGIVCYVDDDAWPDRDWLTYLAATFRASRHAAVGGPNLAPPGGDEIAECIDRAPGNPTHVLLSDQEAEHIPGCNMAFRKSALEAIGGFDPRFRIAGDDVDVCWRIQERGWTIGFSGAAMVWHRRRSSIRAFWKQQLNYGRAEGLLERKWPEKYNAGGSSRWSGRIYSSTGAILLGRHSRIYHGVWGQAPFQPVHSAPLGVLSAAVRMPEWYLVVAALALLSTLGIAWSPMLAFLPLAVMAAGALILEAARNAGSCVFPGARRRRFRLRAITTGLHLLQPLARLVGRMRHGLTPWRLRVTGLSIPRPMRTAIWCEDWKEPSERIRGLEAEVRSLGAAVFRGGDYDRWDLEVRGGLFSAVRLMVAVEDHGSGKQYVRLRSWPTLSPAPPTIAALLLTLSGAALSQGSPAAAVPLALAAAGIVVRALGECAAATAVVRRALSATNES
jgi:GT2 family glycosyltransferase